METTHRAESWQELLKCYSHIEQNLSKLKKERSKRFKTAPADFGYPLFRGQSNAHWELTTTLERELERQSSPALTLRTYHSKYVRPAYNCISGFSEKKWAFKAKVDCSYIALHNHNVPNYSFLAYLRHHGFPSPLLDWTTSFYLATFFAFQEYASSDDVAIYWYQEKAGKGKDASSMAPRIAHLERWIAAHRRHVLQQSEYTIAFRKDVGGEAKLIPHSDVFKPHPSDRDLLFKIVMPALARKSVLQELYKMNINSYSVYQTEDSLVKSVAYRLFNDRY
jgi:hypothetical protein